MTLKLRLLIPCVLLFWSVSSAQESEVLRSTTDLSDFSFLDRTEFKASYSGNVFWNNGINLGVEYLLRENKKTKYPRKRGQRTNTHEFLLNGTLGFITNFSSKTDTGIFTNYGITWRRTNKKNKQFSIAINPLGYYRSILPETYEVTGDQVNKVSFPGRGYYAPSISFGIGKQRKGKKLTGRFYNVNLMLRTPFNATTLPSINFEFGQRFNFKKKKSNAGNK
jgi:hypothetical protein